MIVAEYVTERAGQRVSAQVSHVALELQGEMFAVAAAELEDFTEIPEVRRYRHVEVAAETGVISAAPLDDLNGFDAGEFLEESLDDPERRGPFGFVTGHLKNDRNVVRLDDPQHPSPCLEALFYIQRGWIHCHRAIWPYVGRKILPALDRAFGSAGAVEDNERVLLGNDQLRWFAAGRCCEGAYGEIQR